MSGDRPAVVIDDESARRAKKRTAEHCSICTARVRSNSISLMEPESVPEPRHSWLLCRNCYQALLVEMRRSPVRSHLRLRIAIGLVASERWPESSSSTLIEIADRRRILFIAWGFVIAMLIHLILIVAIAYVIR